MLWKITHYRIIEEYRKSLKAFASQPLAPAFLNSKEGQTQLANHKLVAAAFRAFVTESTSFYLSFINKLKDSFRLERVNDIVCKKLDVYATEDGWEPGMSLFLTLLKMTMVGPSNLFEKKKSM